jgi:hypothetical protein
MEQKYVKAQTSQMDTGEEDVVETRIQPSTEVQALTEAQLRVMEIDMRESNAIARKRHTIMDKITFMEKVIRIPNLG